MSNASETQEPAVVTRRTLEMAVAVIFMVVAVIVMVSTWRLGAGWDPTTGPQSGYFPFYVSLIMFIGAAGTLGVQMFSPTADRTSGFVTRSELTRVMQVLVPTAVFVVLSIYIGIYISSFLYIGLFMVWLGKYPVAKTLPVALGVPILLFVVFERWFLVPLPKGPVEHWLGY